MISFAIFVSVFAAAVGNTIDFPSVKYVKPGDSFTLICNTDASGIVDAIYAPDEDTPSDAELEAASRAKTDSAFTHATGSYKKEYVEANKEDHAGWYTCVVFRQGDTVVEQSRCLVIIEDLCENLQCAELETCVADYDAGTSECQCVEKCDMANLLFTDIKCTDTCENLFECEIRHRNCQDGKDRQIWRHELCPFIDFKPITPILALAPGTQEIYPDAGEEIPLDCGIIQDGTPELTVVWIVDGQEDEGSRNQHQYTVSTFPGMSMLVQCKMLQCKDETSAKFNRWFIVTESDDAPTTMSPTKTSPLEEPRNRETLPIYPVCSIYPAGVIEQFDTQPAFYDLSCSHVLAADFAPDGDYTQGWYIYGNFDVHDDDAALAAMTIFVGSTAFELQRGWIVSIGQEKLKLVENEPQKIGDCEVTFAGLHLRAACPHFNVFYDGFMSGHIQTFRYDLTYNIYEGMSENEGGPAGLVAVPFDPRKTATNIGLCWDNQSGFRPNWQIDSRTGCSVDTSLEECQEETSNCSDYVEEYRILPGRFSGLGAEGSCSELHCGGGTPTKAQECSLEQAHSVNKQLIRFSADDFNQPASGLPGCPEDKCEWKLDIVSRGCPQDNPPFDC